MIRAVAGTNYARCASRSGLWRSECMLVGVRAFSRGAGRKKDVSSSDHDEINEYVDLKEKDIQSKNRRDILLETRSHNKSEITEELADSYSDIPWYLRDDASSPLVSTRKVELPSIPANAPPTLAKFLNLVANEYGLDNIELFDSSVLDEDHPYSTKGQDTNYFIIGTGKSEKHLFKAATELKFYIKHHHDVLPPIEGMVSSSVKPVVRRRLLRRARKGPPATDNDYGKAPNSWIMFDTKVDGIYVHMLTQARRDELNLESLYCREEDLPKYESVEGSTTTSDDIFIGIRRGFHTQSAFAKARANYSTQSVYTKLINEDSHIGVNELKKLNTEFSESFNANSIQDHRAKFKFYRAVHLVQPEFTSFEELEQILLEKYASLEIALDSDINLQLEKANDIVEYMKLLVDSPEITQDVHYKTVGEHCDGIYDKLSRFMSKILVFGEPIDLFARPEFLPLLWRLSYVESKPGVGSNLIHDIIYNDKEFPKETAKISQATNRARDIMEIIKYHNSLKNTTPTAAFKELVLFTYGNDSNWTQFWAEWDRSHGSFHNHDQDTKTLLGYWVRLSVYLSCRQDKLAMMQFFQTYWENSSNSRSFLGDYHANGSQFGSSSELNAFKVAVQNMLNSLNENDTSTAFGHIQQFVDNL